MALGDEADHAGVVGEHARGLFADLGLDVLHEKGEDVVGEEGAGGAGDLHAPEVVAI